MDMLEIQEFDSTNIDPYFEDRNQVKNSSCGFFGISEGLFDNAYGESSLSELAMEESLDSYKLAELNISDKDLYTIKFSYACANLVLCGVYDEDWIKILACDFFVGVCVKMNGINVDELKSLLFTVPGNNVDELKSLLFTVPGNITYPIGHLRTKFIELGEDAALDCKLYWGEKLTYRNFLDQCSLCLKKNELNIKEWRHYIMTGDLFSISSDDIQTVPTNDYAVIPDCWYRLPEDDRKFLSSIGYHLADEIELSML